MFMLSAVRGVGLGSAPVARSEGAKGLRATGFVSYEPDEVETAPARWPFISFEEPETSSNVTRRRRLAGPGRPKLGQAVAAASQVKGIVRSATRKRMHHHVRGKGGAMVLYVQVDVDLKFQVGPPSSIAPGLETFEVVGPQTAVRFIKGQTETGDQLDRRQAFEGMRRPSQIISAREIDNPLAEPVKTRDEYTTGFLSPRSPVTLPDEIKIGAGIPLEATHFCYAYPLDCLAGDFERLVAENAANPRAWLEALLIGAYCYFNAEGEMIRINSLALTPSKGVLRLDGAYPASKAAVKQLTATSRMRPLTLENLTNKDFEYFAWVNPSENPGGKYLAAPGCAADWMHGCFVYQKRNGDSYYFRIDPTPESKPFAALDRHVQHEYTKGMSEMHHATYIARRKKRHIEKEIASWQIGPIQRWCRTYGVAIVVYYVFGVWLYDMLEGWSPVDVIYFLTISATTVGYGDYAPSTVAGRVITTFYAPFGSIFIVVGLMATVHAILQFLLNVGLKMGLRIEANIASAVRPIRVALFGLEEDPMHHLNHGAHRQSERVKHEATRRGSTIGTSLKDGAKRLSSAIQQTRSQHHHHAPKGGSHHQDPKDAVDPERDPHLFAKVFSILFGPMTLMIILTISLCINGWTFANSMYFSMVSMTTIGYGDSDLLPNTIAFKLLISMFLLVGTSALATAISEATTIRAQLRIRKTNWKMKSLPLLLDRCKANPYRELTQSDFLGAVLIDMDIITHETLAVINAKFKDVAGIQQVLDDESFSSASNSMKKGSFDAHGHEQTISAKVLYAHLVEHRQVLDQDDPRGFSRDGKEIKPHIDLCAMDRGYKEWFDKYWRPQVRLRAANTGHTDNKFKTMRRNSGNATTLPTPAAVKAAAEIAKQSPMSRYLQGAIRRSAGVGSAVKGSISGFSTGRSDRPETDREVEKRRNSRERDLEEGLSFKRANNPQKPSLPPKPQPTKDWKDGGLARAPPSVLGQQGARDPPSVLRAPGGNSNRNRQNGGQQQQQQQPFGLISTVSSIWKGEEIGKLKV